MKDVNFESSTLWQRTLGSNRDEDKIERDRLRSSYMSTRENASFLLNELSHTTPMFTVHDVSHVDALWETASMICGASVTLTPAEAYVLGCAFIFHDAAMGAAAFAESIQSTIGLPRWRDMLASFIVGTTGNWPTQAELEQSADDVAKACTVNAIRDLHAAHAVKLVDQPWVTSAGNDLYLIDDLQLRESYGPLIGDLAASHWWPVERLYSEFKRARGSLSWHPTDWIVDPLKLACILRLADATQIDSRRAPTFLFALRRPEGDSQKHWRFQEHVARPQLHGDRVTYTAWRPFEARDADAWWLALDYLRQVDGELKAVDSLLHDHNKPRFDARAVAGVDSPERFSEHFPVRGWRPVDARINVSDVPKLVESLGGEQLYGKEPEVALRELLQNAQDATLARVALDSTCVDPYISVSLKECQGDWTLEVADQGVGMDEEILTSALLDFGSSGWATRTVREKFVGLADGGFRPRGRFGIGFFSTFMLGDNVEIVSRRFDKAYGDARRLRFRGVRERPILTPVSSDEHIPAGTLVKVKLDRSPYDDNGLFSRTYGDGLSELIQRLSPERSITVRVWEQKLDKKTVLRPVDLKTASAQDVFDLLYPSLEQGGPIGEKQRLELRAEFVRRATEVTDENGKRIGLAALGRDIYYAGPRDLDGVVLVNGFRADAYFYFSGYMDGQPSRASRDKAELVANKAELRHWLLSQETCMRELELLSNTFQLEYGQLLHLAHSNLTQEHHVAMVAEGLLRVDEIVAWASDKTEVLMSPGWPIALDTRPPRLVHPPTGIEVTLPENWIYPAPSFAYRLFDDVLGSVSDDSYEDARLEPSLTWRKQWWRMSGKVEGFVLKLICQAWSCDVEKILAPVAEREWNDFADIGYAEIGQVPVYRLTRPRNHG